MALTLANLTKTELALLMGTILGDAHIQRRGGSCRIKISHGDDQKAYVFWKYNLLKRLCQSTQPPRIEVREDGSEAWVFYTASDVYACQLHDLFYKLDESTGRYVKVVTKNLIQLLPMDPVLVAVFFMDDGSVRDDAYSGKLATQGFTKDENNLLGEYLAKWGVVAKTVYHSKKKNQYYLSLAAKTFGKFVGIIENTVKQVPEMGYKLNEKRRPRND